MEKIEKHSVKWRLGKFLRIHLSPKGLYLMYVRKNLSRNSPSRVERLKEIGCRGVYAVKRKLVTEIPVPLCCITLLKPIESVGEAVMLI